MEEGAKTGLSTVFPKKIVPLLLFQWEKINAVFDYGAMENVMDVRTLRPALSQH